MTLLSRQDLVGRGWHYRSIARYLPEVMRVVSEGGARTTIYYHRADVLRVEREHPTVLWTYRRVRGGS